MPELVATDALGHLAAATGGLRPGGYGRALAHFFVGLLQVRMRTIWAAAGRAVAALCHRERTEQEEIEVAWLRYQRRMRRTLGEARTDEAAGASRVGGVLGAGVASTVSSTAPMSTTALKRARRKQSLRQQQAGQLPGVLQLSCHALMQPAVAGPSLSCWDVVRLAVAQAALAARGLTAASSSAIPVASDSAQPHAANPPCFAIALADLVDHIQELSTTTTTPASAITSSETTASGSQEPGAASDSGADGPVPAPFLGTFATIDDPAAGAKHTRNEAVPSSGTAQADGVDDGDVPTKRARHSDPTAATAGAEPAVTRVAVDGGMTIEPAHAPSPASSPTPSSVPSATLPPLRSPSLLTGGTATSTISGPARQLWTSARCPLYALEGVTFLRPVRSHTLYTLTAPAGLDELARAVSAAATACSDAGGVSSDARSAPLATLLARSFAEAAAASPTPATSSWAEVLVPSSLQRYLACYYTALDLGRTPAHTLLLELLGLLRTLADMTAGGTVGGSRAKGMGGNASARKLHQQQQVKRARRGKHVVNAEQGFVDESADANTAAPAATPADTQTMAGGSEEGDMDSKGEGDTAASEGTAGSSGGDADGSVDGELSARLVDQRSVVEQDGAWFGALFIDFLQREVRP